MKRPTRLLLAIALLVPIFAFAQAGKSNDIAQLAWLTGDWKLQRNALTIEEHWTAPAGGTMIGMGRTLKGEKTVEFEFLRIESRADGLHYVAQPNGQPPTDFKAMEVSDKKVVFSNPEHDFPKRVIYLKNADGTVTARVEGDAGGKEKAQEFPYQRFAVRAE